MASTRRPARPGTAAPGCLRWSAPALLAAVLAASGCYIETIPPVRSAAPLPLPVQLQIGRPQSVETPGPPPASRGDAPPVCEDTELAVPGFWDFYGEWCWVASFCARVPVGYAYVPPRYGDGTYVRAHLVEDERAGKLRTGVRLVHPPGILLRDAYLARRASPFGQPGGPGGPGLAGGVSAGVPPVGGAGLAGGVPVGVPPVGGAGPVGWAPPGWPGQAGPGAPGGPVLPGGPGAPPVFAGPGLAPGGPGLAGGPSLPSVEQCLTRATQKGARRDPDCAQVLGGEIRVR